MGKKKDILFLLQLRGVGEVHQLASAAACGDGAGDGIRRAGGGRRNRPGMWTGLAGHIVAHRGSLRRCDGAF